MTYVELRKSAADITQKLNEYAEKYNSVTIEADKHGIRVIVWKTEAGNRAPAAMSRRNCIGDCLNEIDRKLKENE